MPDQTTFILDTGNAKFKVLISISVLHLHPIFLNGCHADVQGDVVTIKVGYKSGYNYPTMFDMVSATIEDAMSEACLKYIHSMTLNDRGELRYLIETEAVHHILNSVLKKKDVERAPEDISLNVRLARAVLANRSGAKSIFGQFTALQKQWMNTFIALPDGSSQKKEAAKWLNLAESICGDIMNRVDSVDEEIILLANYLSHTIKRIFGLDNEPVILTVNEVGDFWKSDNFDYNGVFNAQVMEHADQVYASYNYGVQMVEVGLLSLPASIE